MVGSYGPGGVTDGVKWSVDEKLTGGSCVLGHYSSVKVVMADGRVEADAMLRFKDNDWNWTLLHPMF
jgi:hypothetical protein